MNKRIRQAGQYGSGRPINDVTARGLGWFSIGLGAAEVMMPRLLGRALGMPYSSGLLFLYGLREIATGAGILKAKNPTPWLWGRVAGDAIDLATLAAYGGSRNRLGRGIGIAAVAGVTALDLTIAKAASERDERRSRDWLDYSDRSGFARSVEDMRGAALRELEMPQALKTTATAQNKALVQA